MPEINMFEQVPEGFRLATDSPVDTKLVNLTVAQAFAEYPYPMPSTECPYDARLKLWYSMSETEVANALEHGYILTNDDYSAVMIVVPYEHACVFDTVLGGQILRENATEADAENLLAVVRNLEQIEAKLDWAKDAVYLDILAVQPQRQGKKESSRLMQKLFEECDKINRDVILFTHTDRNAAIYNHFGYETVEKLVDEEHNSTCYCMLRRHHS